MKSIIKALAFTKQASLWGFVTALLSTGIYLYGYTAGASTITYKAAEVKHVEVVREVEKERKASVMERIADCESGDNGKRGTAMHMKNGKLITNTNKDGSVDVGIYQINMKYWALKAMEMDLNLTKEADNIKFAYWLYDNHGTEPWVWSKSCWNK